MTTAQLNPPRMSRPPQAPSRHIQALHADLGGDAGWLGPCVGRAWLACDGSVTQPFAHGTVTWSPALEAHHLRGPVLELWAMLGLSEGLLCR